MCGNCQTLRASCVGKKEKKNNKEEKLGKQESNFKQTSQLMQTEDIYSNELTCLVSGGGE